MARFRRTKDEVARGLTPAEAEAERTRLRGGGHVVVPSGIENPEPPSKSVRNKGDIVIRIRPAKGVDIDYFEHLRGREIEVTQDEKFYAWLDHYASKVYDEVGQAKLFQDLLDQGIGELIKHTRLTKDIK